MDQGGLFRGSSGPPFREAGESCSNRQSRAGPLPPHAAHHPLLSPPSPPQQVDRPQARSDWVVNQTFDLFLELNASEEQMDFPVVYASGLHGKASMTLELTDDMAPLFDTIISTVKPPLVDVNAPLQLLVTNLDYDDHKGRIAIGRINAGRITKVRAGGAGHDCPLSFVICASCGRQG